MENLQLVLFVLGAVAIIAVLVHGFWSIRRQQPKSLKESPMTGLYTDKTRDSDGFDADGVGPVRVVKNNVGDHPLHLNTAYSIELNNAVFIPEWEREIRIMLEEDAMFDASGVWYLDGRQTALILIEPELSMGGK